MKRKASKKKFVAADPDGFLTPHQEKIIRTQIRKNSAVINILLSKIDLLANKERCPKDANTLVSFRKRLSISMEENDNFRKVLWKHLQVAEHWKTMPDNVPDPISFVLNCIKTRKNSLLAQSCWK